MLRSICCSNLPMPKPALAIVLIAAGVLDMQCRPAAGETAKPSVQAAPSAQLSNEEMLRNLQCMEQRLRALEGQVKSNASGAKASGAKATEGQETPERVEPSAAEKIEPFPSRFVRGPEAAASSKTVAEKGAAKSAPAATEPAGNTARLAKREPKQSGPAAVPAAAADPCKPSTAPASSTANLLPPLPASARSAPAEPQQQLLPPLPGASAPSENTTAKNKGILGLADSPVPGLSIGAYGEIKYGAIQNPAAAGQWQNGFDAHRIVLLPTYAITPNIIFNAEIEFEHGGIAFDSDDKLHGSVDVEQIFVDFLIHDRFNWRSPGIDLVPIGYINQHHEPTQFYSVKRPELYNGLIPSTWRVPATSVFGTITDGIKYQLQLSSSLEDFGDDFGLRTDANTVPIIDPVTLLPIPFAAGITGLEALGLSRPVVGDFRQLSNDLAWAGKLDFSPPFLPGLGWSVSGYYSPNTTPRGAHDDFGNPLGRSSLTMFDAEFRYRIPKTWVELRGEYVRATFGNPINLRANNDLDPTNNVGKFMWGYSYEAALHIPLGTILGSEWKAVPFYRYTYQNFQTCAYAQPGGVAQADLCLQTGDGQMRFQDFGLAVFPSPKIVLKGTYQRVRNNNPLGAQSDSILGGVGFFF
jgi:hypothetical protein